MASYIAMIDALVSGMNKSSDTLASDFSSSLLFSASSFLSVPCSRPKSVNEKVIGFHGLN